MRNKFGNLAVVCINSKLYDQYFLHNMPLDQQPLCIVHYE